MKRMCDQWQHKLSNRISCINCKEKYTPWMYDINLEFGRGLGLLQSYSTVSAHIFR